MKMGWKVLKNVGRKEKRELLKKRFKKLKDRKIWNYSEKKFEKKVIVEKEGRGVDMVINYMDEEKMKE
jgi:NADPH:quinone reductase-like Zn-dependent oxidoreductase